MSVKLIKHTLKRDLFGAPYRLPARRNCQRCGSNNVSVVYVPGRAMGGAWVEGSDMSDCNYCGARTLNAPKGA